MKKLLLADVAALAVLSAPAYGARSGTLPALHAERAVHEHAVAAMQVFGDGDSRGARCVGGARAR